MSLRAVLATAASLVLAATAQAQGQTDTLTAPPSFDDYQVMDTVDTRAEAYRPMEGESQADLKELVEMLWLGGTPADLEPSFAGHYAVVSQGCGTECSAYGLVDLSTGTILFPAVVAASGIDYRVDSRLVVVNDPEYEAGRCLGEGGGTVREGVVRYVVWTGEEFQVVFEETISCGSESESRRLVHGALRQGATRGPGGERP